MRIVIPLFTTVFLLAGCAGTEEQTTTSVTEQEAAVVVSDIQVEDTTAERTVSADNQVGRDQNIVALAQFTPELSTFFELIRSADLTVILESPGNYTVFAPTDEAFKALPPGTLDALKDPVNRDDLRSLIRSHLLEDKAMEADLRKNSSFKTMLGKDVNVEVKGGTLVVGKATVLKTDIDASNGVVHIIDSVLIPPKQ